MTERLKDGSGGERFVALLEPYMLKEDLENVKTAYVFAKNGHRGQTRESGERYFEHPRAVALIIIEELQIRDNGNLIVIALLHDILEDSFMLDEKRLQKNFGRRVTLWLKFLTKDPKEGYHERLVECGIWEVWTTKLADRLHNVRTLGTCTPEKQRKQILETKNLYLPLADRLLKKMPKKYPGRAEYLKKEIEKICAEYSRKLQL